VLKQSGRRDMDLPTSHREDGFKDGFNIGGESFNTVRVILRE
jgi:hypothetical protein